MACRWLGVMLLAAAFGAGCADAGTGGPRGDAGVGGTGGTGGGGGMAGGGGTAGVGGSGATCTTNVLCASCPSERLCDGTDDCSVGFVCIESGCDSLDGVPIKHCVFGGGGACSTTADCPPERECMEVSDEGMRCIKTTPGCTTRFDCVPGFSCENGACIDRRVPCDVDGDCPKNHLCFGAIASEFCVRIQMDCAEDFDCFGLAPFCADIDGDGNKECAGVFDPNAPSLEACLNASCVDDAAPVCEAGAFSSTSECGQYGPCLSTDDCAAGSSCVGLWPDGRKECVPSGGSCSSFTDCPVRQVCASPREGGPPSCQVGYQP